MGKQIFISYKAEERNLATKIKNKIEKSGHSCWMAPASIPGGSNYAAEIENAIVSCRALVLVFSKAAMNSKWVDREVDRAINHDKLILPFRTELFPFNSQFNFYLTNVQFYDAFEDYDDALSRLIAQIDERFERDLPVEPEEPAEPEAEETTDSADTEDEKDLPVEPEVPAPAVAPVPVAAPAEAAAAAEPAATAVKKAEKKDTAKNKKEEKEEKKKRKEEKKKNEKKPVRIIKKIFKIAGLIVAGLCLLIALILVVQECGRSGVSDNNSVKVTIAGEEYYTSETSLEIEDYELTSADIVNISNLTNLSYISLINCGLDNADIGKIKAFHSDYGQSVYEINLSGNEEITGFDNLKNTEALKYLNVSNTGITSFDGFDSNFSSKVFGSDTVKLIADNCAFTSFDGLEFQGRSDNNYLFSFKNCSMDNKLAAQLGKKLEVISGFETIYLNDNLDLTDLSFLGNCSKLKTIYASQTGVTSFSGLEKCIYLTNIYASNCKITTLKGLENTTILKQVDFSGNQLKNIGLLKYSAKTITFVNLSDNQLDASAADVLKLMNNLSSLYIRNNKNIADDSFLEGKENMKYINISGCSLTGFECIKSFTNLIYLNISGNQLKSFDCASLPESIKILDLSNNNLSLGDILFKSNTHLDYLNICGNTYKSINIPGECSFLALDYVAGADFKGIASCTETVKMLNCPLNRQVAITRVFGSYVEYISDENYKDIVGAKLNECYNGLF